MDNQSTKQRAGKIPASSWPEGPRSTPPFREDLPSSENQEFWGKDDSGRGVARMVKARREDIEQQRQELFAATGKNHTPKIVGRVFICTSCPYEHTLPIDPNKFTLNHTGQVVAIDAAPAV